MRAIAGPGASDGLGHDFLGFLCGAGLTAGIHFGKIFPKFRRLFPPPLIREGRGIDDANADGFIFNHAPSQQAFDDGLLVGREIFGVADHGLEPDYIMTDWILGAQHGFVTQNLVQGLILPAPDAAAIRRRTHRFVSFFGACDKLESAAL
jgi:hypothetical protein